MKNSYYDRNHREATFPSFPHIVIACKRGLMKMQDYKKIFPEES